MSNGNIFAFGEYPRYTICSLDEDNSREGEESVKGAINDDNGCHVSKSTGENTVMNAEDFNDMDEGFLTFSTTSEMNKDVSQLTTGGYDKHEPAVPRILQEFMSGKDDAPNPFDDELDRISGVSIFNLYMDGEEEISLDTADENMDSHSPEGYSVTCNVNSPAEGSSPRYEMKRTCVFPHGIDWDLWKTIVGFAVDRMRIALALSLVDKDTLHYLMKLEVRAYPYDQEKVRK